MLGAIIGDIIGSRFEFNNTFSKDFNFFDTACSFTDDTICTIAVADALLKKQTYKNSLLYWCRKYPRPMGSYGVSFQQWIFSADPKPYNSFGNGSAMRVSPVAWWFNDENTILQEAQKTAEITHNHPEGIKGAMAVALAIYLLRKKVSDKEFIARLNCFYADFQNKTYPVGNFDETCQGTVPVCLQIILRSSSFEDALRNAISFGGDSDTIGAIVGSMAEAKFTIPKNIYQQAIGYLPDEMMETIFDFYNKINIIK